MLNKKNRTVIKLSGNWNLSGLKHQIESLSTLYKLKFGLKKLFRIDCSKISSIDISGLQLLYVWIQCLSIHDDVKSELINLPEVMQQTIKRLGLNKCFSAYCIDAR